MTSSTESKIVSSIASRCSSKLLVPLKIAIQISARLTSRMDSKHALRSTTSFLPERTVLYDIPRRLATPSSMPPAAEENFSTAVSLSENTFDLSIPSPSRIYLSRENRKHFNVDYFSQEYKCTNHFVVAANNSEQGFLLQPAGRNSMPNQTTTADSSYSDLASNRKARSFERRREKNDALAEVDVCCPDKTQKHLSDF